MINKLDFTKFLDLLRGDKALIKGWFPIEQDITAYDEDGDASIETVKKIGILYDCHLLYFDDENGDFLKLLDDEILDKKTTLRN